MQLSSASLPGIRRITARADFSAIRYAQCWEDADVLLAGLDIQPGDRCLSIASAGDNTLALLARSPEHVLALDVSDAQLACLALRVAAYRVLEHPELLELMGSRPSTRREELYLRCRPLLKPDERALLGRAARCDTRRHWRRGQVRALFSAVQRARVAAGREPRTGGAAAGWWRA